MEDNKVAKNLKILLVVFLLAAFLAGGYFYIRIKQLSHGGATPAETWNMFVDALKKGDANLAVNYFASIQETKAKEWLDDVKNKNELDDMVGDLSASELVGLKKEKDDAEYGLSKDKKDPYTVVVFVRNKTENIWKILKFKDYDM